MEDEELKVLLRENIEVSKESLKILKKINRGRIFGNIFSVLKWTLILGLSFGTYYYIEPFLSQYVDMLKGLASSVENIGEISNNINSATSPDFLKKLQDLMPR
ncbi:MAG: hypothetical protein UW04_C0036G0013 [Parcubacteria group bacterium GW2011_GWB1_43_8]|nr:MAG: hypothetical protein UW04_C0036G0013 [Parcubacteria group bacterium GW2011_GWB1_43_8]